MTSQPHDKTRDSTKHDIAKFGLDLHEMDRIKYKFVQTLWQSTQE